MSSLIQQVTRQMSSVAAIADGQGTAASRAGDFSGVLASALGSLREQTQTARVQADKFEAGDSHISLNDVMLGMQKATISLQLGVQVRNKLVNAYTDIMNMSV